VEPEVADLRRRAPQRFARGALGAARIDVAQTALR
jgi:hypothetical protein